mgnify:CR=1 FL=1
MISIYLKAKLTQNYLSNLKVKLYKMRAQEMNVFERLVFPNGSRIPNRIAKAAMEENMADLNHAPSEGLMRLYQAWADGGVGLIITGNVMVDRRDMTGPGGVV